MPRSHVFSRAWRRLHVFALNSDWFTALFASVVIGQSNCFGFGFYDTQLKTALRGGNKKSLHVVQMFLRIFPERPGYVATSDTLRYQGNRVSDSKMADSVQVGEPQRRAVGGTITTGRMHKGNRAISRVKFILQMEKSKSAYRLGGRIENRSCLYGPDQVVFEPVQSFSLLGFLSCI